MATVDAQTLPTPDISVILPIFNAAPYLDQALDSVQAQTLENIEIICINDGSTDNSLEIMRAHAALDSRIRIFDRENHGYGAEMNFGIDAARGTYIAILEPDDWILPDMLADMFCYAATFDTLIDIVKTPYWRIWMPDTPEQLRINCSFRGRIKPALQPFTMDDPGVFHLLRHHPCIWSAIYRRGFLTENNIRFHEIPGAGWADNPFLLDTLLRAKTIVYLDKPYYCYREETPEKTRNMAIRQTLLPFERWNDMQDIIDELHITNERILRVQINRGFIYLGGVMKEVPLSREDVFDATCRMFARMDPDLVFTDPDISPSMKAIFADLRELPAPAPDRLGYAKKLVREGVYNLKNTGPRMTLNTLKGVIG